MDTSDSSMDTTNGGSNTGVAGVGTITSVVAGAASLTLVKAETPELLAGTSTTSSSVAGPVTAAGGLFAGIAAGNKSARPDDWLAANSPGSPTATLQGQHVVYTNPQQQLTESQQQQPPLAHSSPLAHQQQQQPSSNNGYASPMSTSSYDPYSPNSKIGKWSSCYLGIPNSPLRDGTFSWKVLQLASSETKWHISRKCSTELHKFRSSQSSISLGCLSLLEWLASSKVLKPMKPTKLSSLSLSLSRKLEY